MQAERNVPHGTEGSRMRHVFKATKLGWSKKQEGVWFDSDHYTKEEAEAQFRPYEGVTQKGFPYTGYEYDGQKYHDFTYLGEFPDDEMPRNDHDLLKAHFKKHRH